MKSIPAILGKVAFWFLLIFGAAERKILLLFVSVCVEAAGH